jgi:hypothetical protein
MTILFVFLIEKEVYLPILILCVKHSSPFHCGLPFVALDWLLLSEEMSSEQDNSGEKKWRVWYHFLVFSA